jgi:SAM-dependent methyltransferase
LAAHGYQTIGVDLQEELIRRNRERLRHVRFVCGSIEDFTSAAPFDLITSVTVIQHSPPDAQDRMIANIRSIVRRGGQVIALENVADQDVHVFANSIDGWIARFERAGFRMIRVHRYDYSPFLRTDRFITSRVRRLVGAPARLFRRTRKPLPLDPGAPVVPHATSLRRAVHGARVAALRLLVAADSLVEGPLVEANVPLPTVHCGFQFEAV